MPNFIDLTGKRFGRWLVLKRAENNRHNQPQWRCRCICGNEKVVKGGALAGGESKSCGCLNVDVHRQFCIDRNTSHGLSKTPTYNTWVNMRQRCNNPATSGYEKYGARGIAVCARWSNFENFLADMGERPSSKHSIDRIDNKKGYSPNNCRWATMRVQQNNRGNNRILEYQGKRMSVIEWARHIGKHRNTIMNRLNAGCPLSVVLTPTRHGRWTPFK